MTYLLIYLALGIPVLVALAIVHETGPIWRRLLFAAVLWVLWPLFPITMIRERMACKQIQEICAWCGESVTSYKSPTKYEDWKAHHRQCQKHPLRAEIEALREANRWLPVEERLPEINQPVWGFEGKREFGDGLGILMARLYASNGEGENYWEGHNEKGNGGIVDITHWQPLPQPPEVKL